MDGGTPGGLRQRFSQLAFPQLRPGRNHHSTNGEPVRLKPGRNQREKVLSLCLSWEEHLFKVTVLLFISLIVRSGRWM